MNHTIQENLSQKSTWKRGLFMLLFALFYSVAEIVLLFVVMVQFFLVAFTGKNNVRLLKLGQGIATYIYQIIRYLTFNSEYQSYPFGAWPKGEPVPSKED